MADTREKKWMIFSRGSMPLLKGIIEASGEEMVED
jgi:hypothetical protein